MCFGVYGVLAFVLVWSSKCMQICVGGCYDDTQNIGVLDAMAGLNQELLIHVSCNVETGGKYTGHIASHATSTCVE